MILNGEKGKETYVVISVLLDGWVTYTTHYNKKKSRKRKKKKEKIWDQRYTIKAGTVF